MTKQDFLGVSVEILKASCDQMDDVKAAFRYRSELAIYQRLNIWQNYSLVEQKGMVFDILINF